MKKILFAFVAFSFIAGCHTTNTAKTYRPGQPVEKKHLFSSEILNVYSPNSDDWLIAGLTANGLAFAKRGAEIPATYAAQAVIFEFPPTDTKEEFIAAIQKRIAFINPAPRFREIDSDYSFHEERGYPCVNVKINFDDTAAVTPTGEDQLKLQVIALYCRHPIRKELGFMAAYSYRGKTFDPNLEVSAKEYIDGVNVLERKQSQQ
jgi:hypothetical protein